MFPSDASRALNAERLKELMGRAGVRTLAELSALCRVHERTLMRIRDEDVTPKANTRHRLNELASRLPQAKAREIFDRAVRADQLLFSVLRRLAETPGQGEATIDLAYRHLLRGEAGLPDLPFEALLTLLRNRASAAALANDPSLRPGGHIRAGRVRSGRTRLDFMAGPRVLHSVESASLLWPCTNTSGGECEEPDCPVHSSPNREHLDALMQHEFTFLQYDNLEVFWRDVPSLWPPSIDSMLFAEALRDYQPGSRPRRVLDLGCGTGFLGIWAARQLRGVESVTFADWLLAPLVAAAINAARTIPTGVEADFQLGSRLDWLYSDVSTEFDLVLCNPPYLPVNPQFSDLLPELVVAGTSLLEHLLSDEFLPGSEVVVSFSSLAFLPDDPNWARLEPCAAPVQVPFRLPRAFARPHYLQWLLDERGLVHDPSAQFPYWHEIGVYRRVAHDVGAGGGGRNQQTRGMTP